MQDATGSHRALPRAAGPKGATRATTYADDTTAELALDGGRLVWRVTYEAGPGAFYDAFVDARSGLVRRKVNLVKSATPASVWENYPGAPLGGSASLKDLETNGWLAPGAAVLSGPNAHAYSDVDDNDVAGALGRDRAAPFAIGVNTAFAPPGAGCSVATPCTWNHNSANSWTTNRRQSVVQAFYFANRFHDHLAAAPIGFNSASGQLRRGAIDSSCRPTTARPTTGSPATSSTTRSMLTPPDGRSPRMELWLFRPNGYRDDERRRRRLDRLPRVHARALEPARHRRRRARRAELAAGGSDGRGLERLLREGLHRRAVPGARHRDAPARSTWAPTPTTCPTRSAPRRSTARSVPWPGSARRPARRARAASPTATSARSSTARRCTPTARSGRRRCGTCARRSASRRARRLITNGMRLSPPEPTFLDMRNAILLADQAAGGANRTQIWAVFAQRGMGFYLRRTSEPLQDFSTPPGPGVPRGTITGVIADAATGAAIPNATAAIGSLADGPGPARRDERRRRRRTASRASRARTYSNLVVSAPGYDRGGARGHGPRRRGARRRPAASQLGGALGRGAGDPGPGSDEYADQGCGPDAAVDQLQATAWSTVGSPAGKSMVVALPQAVDVTGFALDPGEGCGDDADSATRDYRIETSTAGANGPWAVASTGAFGPLQRQALDPVAVAAAGVRAVRLTLLSNQGGGAFFDFSELVVHGAPAAAPPVPPAARPAARRPAPPGPPAAPRAPSFTLPASASGACA